MKRPLIALPMGFDRDTSSFSLKRQYAEALHEVGAAPVPLPLLPDPVYISDMASHVDAILLTGSGADIDPRRYGQEPHPSLGPVVWQREVVDALLLKLAEERGLPVMAICYGIQSLNVYRGGTLVQDIPSEIGHAIKHAREDSHESSRHDVEIKPGSILSHVAGGNRAQVNSSHHQAIARVGQGLEPIAWAPDGVVEAVLDTASSQLVLGVQWHPERTFQSDRFSRDLLAWWVTQIKNREAAQS